MLVTIYKGLNVNLYSNLKKNNNYLAIYPVHTTIISVHIADHVTERLPIQFYKHNYACVQSKLTKQ